ncbi:MAG: MFS transporter [Planctomycetota bacterium]|nr:MFS transporter [Planctomycetota bacterium]MDA1165298.1 MFS transporter [Planctomycetota bacterium]
MSDSQSSSDDGSAGQSRDEEIVANEPRNLIVLALFNVTLRFSWIFKTESVLIPRFMDVIDGSGFVRGFLPVLNRFGQSVPPLFLADRLRRAPLKRQVLQTTSTLMGSCFLLLAGLWYWLGEPVNGGAPAWMPLAFLTIYVVFFFVSGMNQLALGTIQGKLIRADRRGRLMALSGVTGSVISVALAWYLLQRWLESPLQLPNSGYVLIFGFAGTGFVLAGLLTLPLREPVDNESPSTARSARQAVTDAWDIILTDRDFRRAAVVAMLFITVQFLFPHFQAFGRSRIAKADEGFHLMLWVIAQNGAVGVFSWASGVIADRYGNRLAIRIQVFLCTATPLLALFLIGDFLEDGPKWFWVAFVFLGLVPVTMKSFVNYTLELAEPANHPRYVSTMSLCFAVPFVLSPLIGMLIDIIGFEPLFLAISVTIGVAGLLTFRMAEPRHAKM